RLGRAEYSWDAESKTTVFDDATFSHPIHPARCELDIVGSPFDRYRFLRALDRKFQYPLRPRKIARRNRDDAIIQRPRRRGGDRVFSFGMTPYLLNIVMAPYLGERKHRNAVAHRGGDPRRYGNTRRRLVTAKTRVYRRCSTPCGADAGKKRFCRVFRCT